MSSIIADNPTCRRVAQVAWTIALGWFLVLILLSFGWVGPFWAFLWWSVPALPLFGLTWYWHSRTRAHSISGSAVSLLVVWVALLLGLLVAHPPTAGALVFWLLFIAATLFPLVTTGYALRTVRGAANNLSAAA